MIAFAQRKSTPNRTTITQREIIKIKKSLKKKLTKFKYKDTVFCPQKTAKLKTKIETRTPRKPNSARRKIGFAVFWNWFFSKDFVYLPGEGHKRPVNHSNQGLTPNNLVLVRNGLTKDLRGLKYKIIHGAQTRRYKFHGLEYRKTARSKYGKSRSKEEKAQLKQLRSQKKKADPAFYKKQRLCSNRFYN